MWNVIENIEIVVFIIAVILVSIIVSIFVGNPILFIAGMLVLIVFLVAIAVEVGGSTSVGRDAYAGQAPAYQYPQVPPQQVTTYIPPPHPPPSPPPAFVPHASPPYARRVEPPPHQASSFCRTCSAKMYPGDKQCPSCLTPVRSP